ncbi:T9SS type A sorting domain-containing protein [Chryseobacterium daeguense]|uniref:T9SS type A sorting domain-containing protein n=1 Tax=Chryseobacterium daeguense TaxID=412438 RepID=UPI000414CEFB|nr:T9SS type A sorting domain-containing protein [Chryseobacterium daeguense]
MRKLLLLFGLLAGFTCQMYSGQTYTVPVCNGTIGTNSYGTLNSNTTANAKSRGAFIIPSSQLINISDGTITSTYLKRLSSSGTLNSSATFKIYLKNTTATDFGSGALDWATAITGATLVYDSNPDTAVGSTAGFKKFQHSANFVYTAGSNLAVFTEYVQATGQTSTINWEYEYSSPCVNTSNSNTTKYVTTSSAFGATLTSSDYRRPHIAFDATVPPPTTVPSCTTISAPANAATGVSVTPTITWAATPITSSYVVNLGTTPGGTDIMNGVDVGNVTSYSIPAATPLNYSTPYYVTVIPKNAIGQAVACNGNMFTTAAMPCPTVSSPSSAATGVSTIPTISWGTVTGATGYRLTVGTTSGGTDVLNNVDLGNVTSYTFASALSASTTYYYLVTAYNTASSSTGCTVRSFTTTAAAPPANDNCAGAVILTVNPDLNCGATTPANTLGASLSMAATPCNGNPDDDVWFKFVATNSVHVVALSNVVSTGTSSATDMYFQVLSGACGSQTSLLCSDPNTGTVTGLTVGETYYVRVYTYAGSGANASFNICIGTPPPPPANDECNSAVALTVNPDLACGSTTAGTTLSATNSNLAVSPCTGTADDDVWYTFVASSTAHVITLSNVVSTGSSSSTSLYTQVLSGTCGTLASVVCGTSNTTVVSGLTPGQTYYVRVYNSNGAGYSNSFNICVGTPPPPPVNDVCSGAIALTVGGNFAANAITTTNAGALTDGTTSCQTSRGDNVWYTVVVPASGNLKIETQGVTGSGFTDTILSVHSGTCGSLTSIACDDDAGVDNYSLVTLTGQTPGTTLYVSVWRYTGTAGGGSTTGQFKLSAYDASLLATDEASAKKDQIKLYPNPFSDVLNISDIKDVKNVQITDISGRLVKTIANPGAQLHLGELKQGMYLVTLELKDGSKQTIKTIKK